MVATRTQKCWSGRMRTLGALLLLIGAASGLDRLVPGARGSDVFGAPPLAVQLAFAAAALGVGGLLFFLGRLWR